MQKLPENEGRQPCQKANGQKHQYAGDDIRRQHTVSARMQSSRNPNELIEVLKDYYMPEVSIIVHNDCFRSDINYFAEGTHSAKFCFLYNSEKQDSPVRQVPGFFLCRFPHWHEHLRVFTIS